MIKNSELLQTHDAMFHYMHKGSLYKYASLSAVCLEVQIWNRS